MLFLPWENFTITTTLNSEQVKERLSNIIEPPKMFRRASLWGKPPAKPYEGIISGNNFRINKIINYRNSFLPIIEGKIYPESFGCQLKIKMNLHMIVIVFLLFWMGNLLPIGLLLFAAMIAGNNIEPVMGVVPLGMCLFAYLLCLICFKLEAQNSKNFLENLCK